MYYIIATAEASSNLARYDGVRYGFRAPDARSVGDMYERSREGGFGREVKRRIILGTYVLSAGYYDAYYLKAQQVRTLIRRDYDAAFAACRRHRDAHQPDARRSRSASGPTIRCGCICRTFSRSSANLAGLPAVTVPCGFASGRLPVGLQFTGRPMDDAGVLRVADAYERATSWSSERPAVPLSSLSR